MNYLFFDIECANSYGGKDKICEFGYVLTDDSFTVKEQKVILINPASPFEAYVINNMLAYPEGVYKSSEKFPAHYDRIASLINGPDTVIIGHTIDADAKYINDDCERYDLPYLKYDFYDIKYIYSSHIKSDEEFGLEKICDFMGIKGPKHAHRSVDDAYATMAIAKEICQKEKLSLTELVKKYPRGDGRTENGEITTAVRTEKAEQKAREEAYLITKGISLDNIFDSVHYRQFFRFLDGVHLTEKLIKCELTGKVLSISNNYQKYHFKEMIALVQILKNHGCRYIQKASECNYFVSFEDYDMDGQLLECTRENQVKDAIEKGAEIKIITFDELFAILGISEKDLSEYPMPDLKKYESKKSLKAYKNEERDSVEYISGNSSTNLGSVLEKLLKK